MHLEVYGGSVLSTGQKDACLRCVPNQNSTCLCVCNAETSACISAQIWDNLGCGVYMEGCNRSIGKVVCFHVVCLSVLP